MMNLVDRAKNICLSPNTEWNVIAGESTPPATLFKSYVIPLAGLSAIAGFIGTVVVGINIGFGTYRVPIVTGLVAAILAVVMAVVLCFLLSLIIDALAPTFGAQKSREQALKVAVYSFTPAWIAGIFQILPPLSLLMIIGGLYALYLMYLGLPKLMKCPEDKALGYTAVVVIIAIVLSIVIGMISGAIAGAGAMGAGMMGMGGSGATHTARVDPNSPLGKLEQIGQQLDASAKKMEAAQKSGDSAGATAAAMEGLGALFGGGKRVEPVDVEQLKVFVPETLGGLPRTGQRAEKAGMMGLMVSTAEATYGDGAGKDVKLEVVGTGGVSGLMSLASWAGVQGEKDDDDAYERTQKVGDRLVHEKRSKRGGQHEYALILGGRFIVTAKGSGVDFNDLKGAVSGLDLAKLEAMKGAGVPK